LKHGFGKFFWNNGNLYDGMWLHNKQHGRGSFYYAKSKESFVGLWQKGKIRLSYSIERDGTAP